MTETTTQTQITNARTRLGSGLFALALRFSRGTSTTQADRESAIKALKKRKQTIDGRKGISYLREQVDACSMLITESRKARKDARTRYGTTSGITRPRVDPIRTLSARGHAGLIDRLLRKIETALVGAVESAFRTDPAGSIDVSVTDNPAKVGISQTQASDWNYYSKGARTSGGFRPVKTITSTTITAPRGWLSRVLKNGLAEIGGLVTLDASPVEGAPVGVELFAARWIAQGRGYSLSVERGFIARQGGESYHGKDAKSALRGLARKVNAKAGDMAMRDLLAKSGIDGIAADHPNLTVTIADARATGSCEYGIRSWCELSGLPYESGTAPIAAVVAAYRAHPMTEARAAILHAIRRQRSALA